MFDQNETKWSYGLFEKKDNDRFSLLSNKMNLMTGKPLKLYSIYIGYLHNKNNITYYIACTTKYSRRMNLDIDMEFSKSERST